MLFQSQPQLIRDEIDVVLIEWTFYYFVLCKCMSTTVRVNGTVQFTFFLVMRLNITVVTNCDLLIDNTCKVFFASLQHLLQDVIM